VHAVGSQSSEQRSILQADGSHLLPIPGHHSVADLHDTDWLPSSLEECFWLDQRDVHLLCMGLQVFLSGKGMLHLLQTRLQRHSRLDVLVAISAVHDAYMLLALAGAHTA